LANVRGTRGRSKWEKLRKKIEPFGRESGLFDGVTVKRLGKSVNDPFQIQVNIQGLSRNLIDVGYGVSQVLPLLFEALSPDSPRTLLIQQPEVHLHPKAQAELATFMTALSKTTGNRFVVETHSDYFVNRMRTLIREKKTSVDDVAILYFERRKHDVKIHRLQIDELGNLIKPPRSYRQFFIKEAGRFLGVK
jgi:predicted ATPase